MSGFYSTRPLKGLMERAGTPAFAGYMIAVGELATPQTYTSRIPTHPTTFTSLPGTTITFFGARPCSCSATFGLE